MKHLLPQVVEPVWVSAIYAFMGAILIEATLSFLGIGLELETVSWGSMLNASRAYFSAWWLAVFPGLSIFLVILALKDHKKKISEAELTNYLT